MLIEIKKNETADYMQNVRINITNIQYTLKVYEENNIYSDKHYITESSTTNVGLCYKVFTLCHNSNKTNIQIVLQSINSTSNREHLKR